MKNGLYKVEPISYDDAKPWILKKHYAHRMPSVSFAFGLLKNKDLKGIITYGAPCAAMNNGECIFKQPFKVKTYELNRLVTNEDLPKNATSYFVSQSLKLLPFPSCIVSFADPNQGHIGYIYQATNWIYTGLSEKGGKDKSWILGNRTYHGKTITEKYLRRIFPNFNPLKTLIVNWENNGGIVIDHEQKYRYIFLIGNKREIKEMKILLKYQILPYPKGDNKRYNASTKVDIQGRLF